MDTEGIVGQIIGIVVCLVSTFAAVYMYQRFGFLGIVGLLVALMAIPVAWVKIRRASYHDHAVEKARARADRKARRKSRHQATDGGEEFRNGVEEPYFICNLCDYSAKEIELKSNQLFCPDCGSRLEKMHNHGIHSRGMRSDEQNFSG